MRWRPELTDLEHKRLVWGQGALVRPRRDPWRLVVLGGVLVIVIVIVIVTRG